MDFYRMMWCRNKVDRLFASFYNQLLADILPLGFPPYIQICPSRHFWGNRKKQVFGNFIWEK